MSHLLAEWENSARLPITRAVSVFLRLAQCLNDIAVHPSGKYAYRCSTSHLWALVQAPTPKRVYVSLGCSASRSRGEAICTNRRVLDEQKLIEHVRKELNALADDPASLTTFVNE